VQIFSLSSVYIVLCSLVCFSQFICHVVFSGFMRWIFFSAMDSSIFVSNNNTLYSLRLYNLNSSFVDPSLYTRLVDGTTNRMIAIGTYSEIYDILVTVSVTMTYEKRRAWRYQRGNNDQQNIHIKLMIE
jgi:hypothetical protein